MTIDALGGDLRPTTYLAHPLHRSEREWTETNCYADLWIEVISALGFDPIPATCCTFSSDFEGDQWTMFKFPPGDLWTLYGIEVAELNVWRPLDVHVVEQVGFGRLVNVDVDAWWLPDTEGVAYRAAHQKTTVSIQMIDPGERRLGYFHNAGYFELSGEDFDGVLGRSGAGPLMPPYVEVVKLARVHPRGEPDLDAVRSVLADHLERQPEKNPMVAFRARIDTDLSWLSGQDLATFHRWAFGTCRQCGANAELAATFLEWLNVRDGGGLEEAALALGAMAGAAKRLQFHLARARGGREVHLDPIFDEMAGEWDLALDLLTKRYGR